MRTKVILVLAMIVTTMAGLIATPSTVRADRNLGVLSTPGECGTRLSPEAVQMFLQKMAQGPQTIPHAVPQPPYCIPLAAHIVRRSDGTGGLSVSQLNQGIADANAAYANMQISFYLVGSVDYIDSDDFFFDIDTAAEINALKMVSPVANAINCYFTPNLCDEDGCWCGMSSFTTDAVQGIAFANDCVGTSSNPSTFPHEIGHYFDLFHTHETQFGAEFVDGSNCTTAGDLLCDTPADPGLSEDVVDGSCVYTGTETDGHGDDYHPDTHQYMSYSRKLCRNVFSPQSEARVVATLLVSRPELIRCPPVADAGFDQTVECASHTTTPVSLNGTGSSQPQGHALTYLWSAAGVAFDNPSSPTPTGQFDEGATVVTLKVTDVSLGLEDTDTVLITVRDTTPPAIVCPADITVECAGPGGNPASSPAIAAFLAGATASDICDASLSVTNDAPPFFTTGSTTVTFSISDDAGNPASCSAKVNVVDTTPPTVQCPANITVECSTHGGTPKDDPQLIPFFAGFSASDICDASLALANNAPDLFPKGTTVVTFTATDDSGNSANCQASVTVVDTTPPTISVTLDRYSLWPPNHRMAVVNASVTVEDICDPNPTFVLTSIASDEPDNGLGDGDRPNDIQFATLGTPDIQFQLRSERQGMGDGRVYTILYTASDDAGNTTPATVQVVVPHDAEGIAYAAGTVDPAAGEAMVGATEVSIAVLSSADPSGRISDPSSALVGNHFGVIRPVEYSWSDLDGDTIDDLTLAYPVDAIRVLAARVDEDGTCAVGFHYPDASGRTYWVSSIYALSPVPGLDEGSSKSGVTPVELYRVRPNPFTHSMSMHYAVSAKPGSAVDIGIYNIAGQRVRGLVSGFQSAGTYEASWDGRSDLGVALPAGVYFLRAQVGGRETVRRVTLMK